MDTKIRKQIYLDPRQDAILKRTSQEMGVSEAEIIRQAIIAQAHRLRSAHRDIKAWNSERRFIQTLMEQGKVPGGRTWRREDLHER
jgi:hypothetical protein